MLVARFERAITRSGYQGLSLARWPTPPHQHAMIVPFWMDPWGFEPQAFALPGRRSPVRATNPIEKVLNKWNLDNKIQMGFVQIHSFRDVSKPKRSYMCIASE